MQSKLKMPYKAQLEKIRNSVRKQMDDIKIPEWRHIRGVKKHRDFTTLPEDVHFHTAFAYASYETPDVEPEKRLFETLRGYTRIENSEFYSIFAKISSKEARFIVAIRGTFILDARDLWEDVLIAFRNDPSGRKEKLISELGEFLDSIRKKYEKISVTSTGHSLGGTVCAQIYNELKKNESYAEIFGDSYSFNPGVSFIPSGTKLWKREILPDPKQHIIVTEGDLVAMSLILMVKKPRAKLYVLTGLKLNAGLTTTARATKWFKDIQEGTGNVLPRKIQVHELPAFFTVAEKHDALTRPQVHRYLELEETVRAIPSFCVLPEILKRRLLAELVDEFNVESDWKEQSLEIKFREVRRMSNVESKRAITLVRWFALRAYVSSGRFKKSLKGWKSLKWNAVLGWVPTNCIRSG